MRSYANSNFERSGTGKAVSRGKRRKGVLLLGAQVARDGNVQSGGFFVEMCFFPHQLRRVRCSSQVLCCPDLTHVEGIRLSGRSRISRRISNAETASPGAFGSRGRRDYMRCRRASCNWNNIRVGSEPQESSTESFPRVCRGRSAHLGHPDVGHKFPGREAVELPPNGPAGLSLGSQFMVHGVQRTTDLMAILAIASQRGCTCCM